MLQKNQLMRCPLFHYLVDFIEGSSCIDGGKGTREKEREKKNCHHKKQEENCVRSRPYWSFIQILNFGKKMKWLEGCGVHGFAFLHVLLCFHRQRCDMFLFSFLLFLLPERRKVEGKWDSLVAFLTTSLTSQIYLKVTPRGVPFTLSFC